MTAVQMLITSLVVVAIGLLTTEPANAGPRPGQLVWNQDMPGGDLKTVPLRGVRPNMAAKKCASICRSTMGCLAVVTKNHRKCVLKKRVGRTRGAVNSGVWINPNPRRQPVGPRAAAAPRPGQTVRNIDIVGGALSGQYGTWRGRSPDTCKRICRENRKCVGFVHKGSMCYFKASIGRITKSSPGATAWAKPKSNKPVVPTTATKHGRCLDRSPLARKGQYMQRGNIKACIASCRTFGHTCHAAVWEPLSANQPTQGNCRLYRSADLTKPDKRGRGWCRMWQKPAAMIAAEIKAERECKANKLNPKAVPTPHGHCRSHAKVWTSWGVQNVLSFKHPPNKAQKYFHPGPFLEVKNKRATVANHNNYRFSYWHIIPVGNVLPKTSLRKNTIKVHLHWADDPNLVLKRQGNQVVLGPPDANALWSMEYSWEYSDYQIPADRFNPGPYVHTGNLVTFRTGNGHKFLSGNGNRLGLTTDPRQVRAHWRVNKLRNLGGKCASPKYQDLRPVTADAPRPAMDMVMVNKMANWVVKQHANAQPDVCWKRGGKGRCKALDRVRNVECGLACTKTSLKCVKDVVDKVAAVGDMVGSLALLVSTAGIGNAVKAVARTAAKFGGKMAMKVAARMSLKMAGRILKKALRVMRKNVKAYVKSRLQRAVREGTQILTAEGRGVLSAALAGRHEEAMTEEIMRRAGERIYLASKPDIAKEVLDAVEAIDPTGIVGVINAFNQPTCGNVPMPR